MYRAILKTTTDEDSTKVEIAVNVPENNDHIEFKCASCGRTELKPIVCPVSGMRAGQGFEHVCSDCRGDMKRKVDGYTQAKSICLHYCPKILTCP